MGLQPRHHEPRRADPGRGRAAQEQLVPIYPADGYYGADNPAVVLTGDWVDQNEADAAEDFIRYAGTAQGQEIVRTSGYRDLNGALDAGVADVADLAADPAGVLPLPAQDVVAAVNTAFPEVRKRAQGLFLMDVSGSMDEPISATNTKLSAARRPSRRRSTTSPPATTWASRPSRRPPTARCFPATSRRSPTSARTATRS